VQTLASPAHETGGEELMKRKYSKKEKEKRKKKKEEKKAFKESHGRPLYKIDIMK
jgi:hypothetical protein